MRLFRILAVLCLLAFMVVPSGAQTTVAPYLNSNIQLLDNSTNACAGCLLDTFAAGSTTPLVTYSESTGTTPNTNPIILDSAGRATVYLTSASYKFRLRTALGATIWTQDGITWSTPLSTFAGLISTGDITLQQSTAATSGANQSSNSFRLQAKYWNGSSSQTDQWVFQDVLGAGSNPTSTLNITHSGSSGTSSVNFAAPLTFSNPTLVNPTFTGTVTGTAALNQTGNVTATTGQNTINAYKFNNIIYVDGIKYPFTQIGIQAALTDACAITGAGAPGTTVYFPPANLSFNSASALWTYTCPLTLIGPGRGQLSLANSGAGQVFKLKPNASYSQNQTWEISGMELTSSSGDTLSLDSSGGFGIFSFYLHDSTLFAGAANCVVNTTASVANSSFDGRVIGNYIFGSVCLNGGLVLGDADGWKIEDNSFSDAAGNTGACITLNSLQGAAQWTVFHNRGGCKGGFIVSTGTTECKIIYNQIEQTSGTGSANGAIIDLQGGTFTIDGCSVIGNNINAHTFAAIGVRLDHVTNSFIEDNVIGVKPTTGTGIAYTANASDNTLGPNEFIGATGGALAVTDSGTRLQRLGNKANNTINTVLFTNADAQIGLLVARRANTQSADIFDVSDENGAVFFGVGSGGKIKVSTGVLQGSGIKHQRFGATCTTAAAVNASCTSTFSWTSAFADANYTVSCTGDTNTNIPILESVTHVAASVTVVVIANSAGAASFGAVDCIAIHD